MEEGRSRSCCSCLEEEGSYFVVEVEVKGRNNYHSHSDAIPKSVAAAEGSVRYR